MRKADFNNLLKVLNRETPARPTLFEFFLNKPLYDKLSGQDIASNPPEGIIKAFYQAGYDYATVQCGFGFPRKEIHREDTISLNEGAMISDRKSFDEYPWPDPDKADYSPLDKATKFLPDNMKVIACGPGGVLENVIRLIGYDNLCFMLVDDPELFGDICEKVGSTLVRHYEISGQFKSVGAMISNDDWGFKSQPMMSPEDMRRFIIPWHRKIAETIHKANRPAILHSCGNLESLMDDIIDDIGYDGKHSYEDIICPVEEAYEKWGHRIAILGGIDLDYLCRKTPEEIRNRGLAMLDRVKDRGSYALGSGNSIPEYVPDINYFAMTSAALGKNAVQLKENVA
jgi:uroporphyrinogen decarboxylase